MKKVIYGVLLVAVFGLTACGNDKKETTASSKVEQLESRVEELESSSSEEAPTKEAVLADIKSDTNKKIAKAFFDAGLEMYVNKDIGLGVTEIDTENYAAFLDPIPETGLSFFIKKVDTGNGYILQVYSYPNNEQMTTSVNNLEDGEYSIPNRIATNDSINSFITSSEEMSEADFNKYKEVFENIK